jgi:ribosome-associated protein
MADFKLKTEYIHLIQLLKYMNLVQSGGEAKMVVEEGMVTVNGETELRKRRKLRQGDKIEFAETTIEVK